MKILTSLLFCFASILSYAQNSSTQNTLILHPPGSENLLDTSNMYNSRYGAVARLTQDNMPCIMPYTQAVPIPNAAKRSTPPDEIPNFWKGEPWKYRHRLNKYMPIPETRLEPEKFKVPGTAKKNTPALKSLSGDENRLKFYMDRKKQGQP